MQEDCWQSVLKIAIGKKELCNRMKRNLFGFALFVTILAITAFIYQTFLANPIPDVPAVQSSQDFLKYPVAFYKNNQSTCRIRQATLDLQTKKLNVELQSCDRPAASGESAVRLQAFIKNSNDVRRVASKTVFVPTNFDRRNNEFSATIKISADWLIESTQSAATLKDNLYLIAQNSNLTVEPSTGFDAHQAVPILLIVGKH